jgi:hypothetical protein
MLQRLESISFLVGSGTSVPAGFPSTPKLTESVLSGEGVWRATDGSYYIAAGGQDDNGAFPSHIPLVTALIRKIERDVDRYYAALSRRNANYEDIYYVVWQLHADAVADYENPAVRRYRDDVENWARSQLGNGDTLGAGITSFADLLREACNYVRDVVWRSLTIAPRRYDHLKCMIAACTSHMNTRMHFITLNHDTLLEQVLRRSQISYVDGFGVDVEGVRYWEPTYGHQTDVRVYVYKLHGSVDWFRFPAHRHSGDFDSIGIPSNWDFWHTRSPSGELQWPLDGRPEFLAGTFNKILSYSSGIYADLFHFFRVALSETQLLIVAGYGFGDKAVNEQVIRWLYGGNERTMLVIDPDIKALQGRCRFAIAKNWDAWASQGRLRTIGKPIQNVLWDEIVTVMADFEDKGA